VEFGMTGFGHAIGEPAAVSAVISEYTADVERVLEYGYRTVHRSPADVGLVDLAVEAGVAALHDAGASAREMDLVVLAVTDIPEYLYWDPAASLQARLGAHGAEAMLVSQGCIGGITSLDSVAGRFATHPEYRRALVVSVNRTCEDYCNRMDTNTLVFSDGAAAAVVERGHPALRWRASEIITDGRYADFYRLEQGGAAQPFRCGDKPDRVRNAWEIMDFFGLDPDRFEAFVNLTNDRIYEVVSRTCQRIGRSVSDLARVILLNDNVQTLTTQASLLGIPLEKTNIGISQEFGHFGAADYLFNLQHHRDAGELGNGDLIALAGMGRGFHWGCAVIEC
jgi:3-oxoacyl-[acyl-carrier-protein] synthase-3